MEIHPKTCGMKDNGCWVRYEKGFIIWSSVTGALPITNKIRELWAGYGGSRGPLGYPVSLQNLDASQNVTQAFQGGSIFVGSNGVSRLINSEVARIWNENGSATGSLGAPLSQYTCNMKNNGCWQQFRSGFAIVKPANLPVIVLNDIRNVWAARGGSSGSLGYPTESVTRNGLGVSQNFDGGVITRELDGEISVRIY